MRRRDMARGSDTLRRGAKGPTASGEGVKILVMGGATGRE